MLVVVARTGAFGPADRALKRREMTRRDAEERALAAPVGADEHGFLPALDVQVGVDQDDVFPVRVADVLQLDHITLRAPVRRELNMHLRLRPRPLHAYHPG